MILLTFRQTIPSILILLTLAGCSMMPYGPGARSNLDWSYQEGERRLNFKNVGYERIQGTKAVTGVVENVGEERWERPKITFQLLDRNQSLIQEASTRRTKPLPVGSKWQFRVIPSSPVNFHRARFTQPTGW